MMMMHVFEILCTSLNINCLLAHDRYRRQNYGLFTRAGKSVSKMSDSNSQLDSSFQIFLTPTLDSILTKIFRLDTLSQNFCIN